MTEVSGLPKFSRAESRQNRAEIGRLMDLFAAGQEAEMLAACQRLARSRPDHPVALYGLAVLALKHGKRKIAGDTLMRAHERDPWEAVYTEMLAVLYTMAGNLSSAVYFAKLSASLGLEGVLPLLPAALPALTSVLATIRTMPLLTSAQTLTSTHHYGKAAEYYESHLTFFADDLAAVRGLAQCHLMTGRPMQALAGLSQQLDRGAAATAGDYGLLGAAHAALGDAAVADDFYRQAEALAGDDIAIGCARIRDAVFDPDRDEAALAALARAWADTLPQQEPPPPSLVGDRPLRIGLLISALRDSRDLDVVAAVLKAANPQQVKRYVFGHGALDDAANVALRPGTDQWQDISECDPFTLAAILQGDEIDVLVDVGGHAAPAHLAAMALRPAPWQVSWLGNPGTLGLAQIDAELADENEGVATGADAGRRRFLANGLYTCDQPAPQPRPAPVLPGLIAFGVDIGLSQLHDDLLAAWARLLGQLPQATLVLRDRGFVAGGLAELLISRFAGAGIADRVDVITAEPEAFYDQVDVVLAPFVEINPHETIAALRQGLPVVALSGPGRHRRQSAALLRRNGLGWLVADDVDGYVATAARLAQSPQAWSEAAATLSQTLATAPLFQPALVAAGFYQAIRELSAP
jgi:tetratricopeptide (TPR) repeat protein